MLGLTGYLVAVAASAVLLVAILIAAVQLRRALMGGWEGAPARLAEVVIAVTLLSAIGLVLGTVSALNRPLLILAAVAASLAAVRLLPAVRNPPASPGPPATPTQASPATGPAPDRPRAPAESGPGHTRPARVAALAVSAVVLAYWGLATTWSLDAGITNFDSVWYHLPFAAEMAQSGSTWQLHQTETVFLNWFYPQGAELLHAIGMVLTERDLPSLALNLGWLGLALLAAWCVGRPFGRGHLTVIGAAVLLTCHNLIVREPGTAKNDIAGIALLLAATALLIEIAVRRERRLQLLGGESGRGGAGGTGLSASLDLGPALLVAGCAAGLAAGVKVTSLAPVFGLTVAVIALTAGARRRGALWWGAGLVSGGAYWYLRNLLAAGNPIPQLRELGPLTLPGPERLQAGRPDFNVAHYLLDGAIWSDYFLPGLERGFGVLWPAVLLLAVAGALLAILGARGAQPASRTLAWLGAAALFGMVSYLFTPLSAAGAEGEPTAFGINLRFAIPAMIMGAVLAPVALPLRGPKVAWGLFAALALLAALTNEVTVLFTDSGRVFGWAIAVALVVVPALILADREWRWRVPAAALLALALIVTGYSLQRGYFENRYADFEPELGLAEPYRWATDREQTRIGLAGTTAGLRSYGFYGADLSNRVTYLAEPVAAGGLAPIRSCGAFREAVNRAGIEYLITSPFLNFLDTDSPVSSPEQRWVRFDPALEAQFSNRDVTLWRVDGRLDPAACGARERPLRELPMTPLPG